MDGNTYPVEPDMPRSKSSLNTQQIIIAGMFLVIGILVGLGLTQLKPISRFLGFGDITVNLPQAPQTVKISPIFQNQTASLMGKISKIEGSMATILKDGKEDTFPLASNFIFYLPVENSPISTASANLSLVRLNEDVSITLQVLDGEYKVTSISYPNTYTGKNSPTPKKQ